MFSKSLDKLKTSLKNRIAHLKYQYYFPLVEKIYHKSYLKEANEMFEKSQLTKQKKEVKIPVFVNEKYNKVFQQFCKSEITEFGFESNKTSLCVVLGPKGIGKTSFIRSNLQKLITQRNKYKVQDANWYNIQTFNCSSFGILNYDTFINNFENTLINSIHQQFSKVASNPKLYFQQNESQFNAINIIKEILYEQYAKEFLNLYARDMIGALINDEEIFIKISDHVKIGLSDLFQTKMVEESADFSEVFEQIVEVLQSDFESDGIKTAILICVSLLSRIEYENRPPKLKDVYYRNGLIVNSFLFDAINYLEGYHPCNKTQTQFAQNVIVLENFDNLFCGYQNDVRFYDFQDHLLLRLYSTDRERNHFPVVIESSNSRFFTMEMFDMMHAPYNTYGTIELYGVPEEQLRSQYDQVFSIRQIDLLKKVIGGNTNTWSRLLENVILTKKIEQKQSNEKNKAPDQKKQIVTFSDILNLQTEFFQREYIQFKSKIQQIYLDNTLAQLLDGVDVQDRDIQSEKKQKDPAENDKIITFYLIDTLNTLVKNYGTLQTGSEYAQFRILENHVVKALLSQNILYSRYYYSYIMFDKYVYNSFAKKYVQELWSSLSLKEKIDYFIWWKKNGIEKSSLLVYNISGLGYEDQPMNAKDFQNFKLNPELFQEKGIDYQVEYLTIKEILISKLLKK
ncbi:hypothetical protein TTHERM_00522140 (macronuclear) [Tetrahymena thermophila SB210]|uniref:Uncharacterized protein n=1 Tax=Tetrahymena thermophila (strain SB210) TaxID=312017 RepID=I7LUK1_TETTS|nr:hypothetical protein TTHERM_00522140 [Tetrahymena thermophila SB210]EAR94147.2 hypothetical protein TTHERM_00522140 [Tetrahymena thermophila SB210]|eukprot:XP_001014392.2 hypothetical protein TTHERM_00522140 [Tetrahymena thermophila SB210]